MLIGIDMLGVQSPESSDRETGRFGRQLVSALLALDPVNRYILYTHEGLSTDSIPTAVNAERVSLPPNSVVSSGVRPSIHWAIDRNPDGLDWLLLLDPFPQNYGQTPPEPSLRELKLASLVMDLAPSLTDDRRLAPLRRHDAILAVSEATAADCRRRLGSACSRVTTLPLACDPSFAIADNSEPFMPASAEELGRLGITGSFLFASMTGGVDRGNLAGVLDAYHRLSLEQQTCHQLVIAGRISNPWSVVSYLYDRGCAEGLVLVGDVNESTLRTLYGRCAAFVSPSIEEGSGLALVEAMRFGAPIVAGNTGAQPEIIGEAGLLVDPSDPVEIADQITLLLSDFRLERELRRRALARSDRFSWEPVVGKILDALRVDEDSTLSSRIRADLAHPGRSRIAATPEVFSGARGEVVAMLQEGE